MSAIRQPFEVAHDVIAKKSHGPAVKSRQPRDMGGVVTGHQLLKIAQRIAVMGNVPGFAVLLDHDLVSNDLKNRPRVGADEAVPRPLLTALDAFEEKGIGSVAQFGQDGQRRFHVGQNLPVNRDQVAGPRQLLEGLKIGAVHRWSPLVQ